MSKDVAGKISVVSKMKHSDLVLLYFKGCPNAEVARNTLRTSGLTNFREVDLEEISVGDLLKCYSSPSLLVGDALVFGSRNSENALSCSLVTESEMKLAILGLPMLRAD
jgi:hypothetical protein